MTEFIDAQFPLVMVPFYGSLVGVRLRELTQAQITACGGTDFSLIETFHDRIRAKKKPTLVEIVQYAEVQHRIVKRALAKPTYDEIMAVCKTGIDTAARKAELDELDQQLAATPSGPAFGKLEERIAACRIWLDLLLPSDFTAAVTSYALGIDKSDIKDVTEDALYEAAVLATLGHDNPADHLSGSFTDFMRDDINRRAWAVKAERERKDAGHEQ